VRARRGRRPVGRRELAGVLGGEFPHNEVRVSPAEKGSPGECWLTVRGEACLEVYARAQVLACVAVLFNQASGSGSRGPWPEFAECRLVRRNAGRTEKIVLRRGRESVRFYLVPTKAVRDGRPVRLYLREL
jgi:hypothetical protein